MHELEPSSAFGSRLGVNDRALLLAMESSPFFGDALLGPLGVLLSLLLSLERKTESSLMYAPGPGEQFPPGGAQREAPLKE